MKRDHSRSRSRSRSRENRDKQKKIRKDSDDDDKVEECLRDKKDKAEDLVVESDSEMESGNVSGADVRNSLIFKKADSL